MPSSQNNPYEIKSYFGESLLTYSWYWFYYIFLVNIGSFKNNYHDIGGQAYALDSKTIVIKGFTYDGEGPDAFFLAGTSGKPSRLNGDVVLPYPFEGKHYSYTDRNIPLLLREFDGSEEVVLTLPPEYSVTDLK